MHLGPDEILLNLEVEFRTGSPFGALATAGFFYLE
jgi:hypothetical protein